MAEDAKRKKIILIVLTVIAVISISTFFYIGLKPEEKAQSFAQCKELFDMKDFAGCITCLDVYIADNPESQAFLMRGDAHFQLKQYEKALSDYSTFLNIDKYSHEVYYKRALVHEKLGNIKLARTDLDIACEFDYMPACTYDLAKGTGGAGGPTTGGGEGPTIAEMLADAVEDIEAEDYANAFLMLDAALALDSNNTELLLFRGLCSSKLDSFDNALDDYNRVLEAEPNNIKALNNRGVVYWKLGRYEDAMKDYAAILNINPNDYIVLNNMGVLNYQMGEFDTAQENFTKVLAINPNFAPAYLNRGVNNSKLNNKDAAKIDFEKACEKGLDLGCTEADKM
jgi:tetratricopeptide (TPR) repeat protein